MEYEKEAQYFEEYREHLKSEIVRLISYVKLYRRLHEKKKNRLAAMNIAPAFFQITMDSLFTAIILWINNLLSRKSKRGLWNFLVFIENHRKLFDISELKKRRNFPDEHWMLDRDPITFDTIKEDRCKIQNLKSLDSIKLRRDKIHAHFDKDYFFDRNKIGQDAPLMWKDMDEVFELMKSILNKYSSSYDGKTYQLVPFNVHDVDRMLDILQESRR